MRWSWLTRYSIRYDGFGVAVDDAVYLWEAFQDFAVYASFGVAFR